MEIQTGVYRRGKKELCFVVGTASNGNGLEVICIRNRARAKAHPVNLSHFESMMFSLVLPLTVAKMQILFPGTLLFLRPIKNGGPDWKVKKLSLNKKEILVQIETPTSKVTKPPMPFKEFLARFSIYKEGAITS